MIKCLWLYFLIPATAGLFAQTPGIDLPVYGSGPFQSTDQSHWSLFRNMAGLAKSDHNRIALGYQIPYNLKELQSLALGIIIPKPAKLGVSFYQSGTDGLINQQLAISASMALSRLSLGIRAKYWSVTVSGNNSLHSISLDAGIQIHISDQVLVGVFMSNLSQSKLSTNETIPVTWHSGISYRPGPKLLFQIEAGHVLGYHWEFTSGIEYVIKEKFFTRTGYNVPTKGHYWGLGFHSDPIEIDYAVDLHPYLGITHQAGISFYWP
jgi:hypothetical protein